jgi:hypothetical protein
MVDVFRDTTERNASRESLRRSEERFRQVAESAGEFIWELDAAGLYLYASPVVEQILGYKPGMPWAIGTSPRRRELNRRRHVRADPVEKVFPDIPRQNSWVRVTKSFTMRTLLSRIAGILEPPFPENRPFSPLASASISELEKKEDPPAAARHQAAEERRAGSRCFGLRQAVFVIAGFPSAGSLRNRRPIDSRIDLHVHVPRLDPFAGVPRSA